MTRLLLLLTLLPSLVFAQPAVTRGGALKKRQYQTYAAMTLYVDPTGSDSNACTSSGTGACLTLGGALNKVPARIRHVVTVNIAAGTYTLSSAYTAPVFSFADAGQLVIQGTSWSNFTPTTGSATGTVTSYTAGVLATPALASIVDSGQTWTADELKGSYVTITSGASSGTSRVIVGNTATTINITGTISGVSAGTTYAIQRPAAIFSGTGTTAGLITFGGLIGSTTATSAVILSDFAVSASGAVGYAMRFVGSHVGTSFQLPGQTVTLRRLRLVGPVGMWLSGAEVTGSTNTTYIEGTTGLGLFLADGFFRDTGAYIRGATDGVAVLGNSDLNVTGAAQWPVYEGGSGVALSLGNASSYSPTPRTVAFTLTLRGVGCTLLGKRSTLFASTVSCTSSSGSDVTLTGGSRASITTMVWSGATDAVTVDGVAYTSTFIEALSPRRVTGGDGSTFTRY